jgi:hypothetical protein
VPPSCFPGSLPFWEDDSRGPGVCSPGFALGTPNAADFTGSDSACLPSEDVPPCLAARTRGRLTQRLSWAEGSAVDAQGPRGSERAATAPDGG